MPWGSLLCLLFLRAAAHPSGRALGHTLITSRGQGKAWLSEDERGLPLTGHPSVTGQHLEKKLNESP